MIRDYMNDVDLNTAARRAKGWRALVAHYPEHRERYEGNAESYEERENVLLSDE